MNLTIIGANGGVGRCLVEQALEAGHQVTAAMRNPFAFPLSHKRLRPLVCDVLDRISVGHAVAGQDAVFCALGESHRKATRLYSEGACNIAAAMSDHKVRRIVFLSNFGMLDETADDWKGRLMLLLVRHVIGSTLADHRRAFETIRTRIPEWVVVRPLARPMALSRAAIGLSPKACPPEEFGSPGPTSPISCSARPPPRII